jgi:hypothetical protein
LHSIQYDKPCPLAVIETMRLNQSCFLIPESRSSELDQSIELAEEPMCMNGVQLRPIMM